MKYFPLRKYFWKYFRVRRILGYFHTEYCCTIFSHLSGTRKGHNQIPVSWLNLKTRSIFCNLAKSLTSPHGNSNLWGIFKRPQNEIKASQKNCFFLLSYLFVYLFILLIYLFILLIYLFILLIFVCLFVYFIRKYFARNIY